jgi:ABC-type uncharacterized transport system substrate-binding protein
MHAEFCCCERAKLNLNTRLPLVSFRLFVVVTACVWCFSLPAVAADPVDVAIVLSEESPAYQAVANSIKAVLAQSPAPGQTVTVLQQSTLLANPHALSNQIDLVVAVGVAAMQTVSESGLHIPVLVTLVPKQAFEKWVNQHQALQDHRYFSAIYLDQPLSRQLSLIRVALPGRSRIGVILGPTSLDKLKPLQKAVQEQKLHLDAARIEAADNLMPTLKNILADNDVLLAIPDPLVFNKGNVQSLLLTSYRYRVPVIGYSQAYVKAGALAGVFSTPVQIGQQAAELIQHLANSGTKLLPVPQYPKYFGVDVNEQVARSLGITFEAEGAVYETLRKIVEQEP